jgi:DnaK suppressor protein
MAATTLKKTMMKKEKQPAAKKKTVKSPLQKMSAKPPEKVKKTFTAKKKEKIITAAKKTAVKKVAAKKTVVKKTGTGKKPQRKTGTSKDRFLDLRKSLLSKKETILKEVKEEIAKYISGDNKQLVDTANDDGDWAQVDISEDLSLQRLSTHRKLMYNIDEAIRKIAEGTYGICEECGEEISEKRLLVLPTATLCVDCQENKEQLDAVEGEE